MNYYFKKYKKNMKKHFFQNLIKIYKKKTKNKHC